MPEDTAGRKENLLFAGITAYTGKMSGRSFSEKGEAKEVMLKSWQKAYYIYRLYEKQEEAEKIRKYLEEIYQWDCII
nr:hypothetical protein [uncultured Blautia sp.]